MTDIYRESLNPAMRGIYDAEVVAAKERLVAWGLEDSAISIDLVSSVEGARAIFILLDAATRYTPFPIEALEVE